MTGWLLSMLQITSKSPCVRGGAAAGGETLLSDVCCLVFVISFISLRWGRKEGRRGGWTFEGAFYASTWTLSRDLVVLLHGIMR